MRAVAAFIRACYLARRICRIKFLISFVPRHRACRASALPDSAAIPTYLYFPVYLFLKRTFF